MKESEDLTYAAVITISLPGAEAATNFTLKLMPSDSVMTTDGMLKPLQDCTLGELSQFADTLEAGLLARYQDSTLVDLALDGEAEVTIQYEDDSLDTQPPADLWLEQIVVLTDVDFIDEQDEVKLDSEHIVESPVTDSSKEQFETESNLDDVDADDELIEAIETTGEDQLNASNVDSALKDLATEDIPIPEVDPFVSVAETESVREEREAISKPLIDEAPIVEEMQRVRILGRRRPLNHTTWTAVDIMINEPAFRDAQAHAISNPDREVAGVLIGPPPEKQPDGRYIVHVSNTIIAKHTRMQGASVTYTPESWRYIHDKLADMYPNDEAVIVGWYHTHPGFGIFLSGMDQFIHRNFFTQIWHIAFVLDPRAHKSGFFCWDRRQTRVDPYEFPWPTWALGSW